MRMSVTITSLNRVLHFATNALTARAFFHLHGAGGPEIKSAVGSMKAAMFRAAVTFEPTWKAWLHQLEQTCKEYATLYDLQFDRPL